MGFWNQLEARVRHAKYAARFTLEAGEPLSAVIKGLFSSYDNKKPCGYEEHTSQW